MHLVVKVILHHITCQLFLSSPSFQLASSLQNQPRLVVFHRLCHRKWVCKPYLGLLFIYLLTRRNKPPSDFVTPNTNNPHPDGFRLGKFSDIDLRECLDGVSEFGQSHPRNAQVTAISWWSSHEAPWHHQFVAVDVTHTTLSQTHGYTLLFERLGKLVGQEGITKQQITIKNRVHETDFLKHSNLICAMATTSVAIKSISQQEIPQSGDAGALRGQPPTLGDVVTYMSMIVAQIPKYHVGKDNCYFFSRMLFHVVVLRHYTTFKFVWIPKHSAALADDKLLVRSPPSPRHGSSTQHPTLQPVTSEPVDPLWITIMHVLKEREDKEGLLFYQRLRIFWRIIHITMILTLPASAYGGCLLGSDYFVGAGFLGIVVGIIFHGIVCSVILTWGPTAIRGRKEELLRKTTDIICCHVTSTEVVTSV
jgi:hypothetical protein